MSSDRTTPISRARRPGIGPRLQEFPTLVVWGKLKGYWLLAPGVFQPPCGFAQDTFACLLPRGHEGPHHMAQVGDES